MDRLLIATSNADKLREIRDALVDVPLRALAEFPAVAEPEETGSTFEENARLKALYYDQHAASLAQERLLTVAEDSGFAVDALDGAPGVWSARFLRPDATYPERFAEIYRRLAAKPNAPPTARFVCALAVVDRGRIVFETTGAIEGEVARTPSGSAGFGYDPIFLYPPYGRTLAEVSQAEKLRVSHRGQAFRTLLAWLRQRTLD